MAYATGHKQCALDGNCKKAGVFSCGGCSKWFCHSHASDHRQKLSEQMNELISEHDDLKNTFTQHISNPTLHPLVKQIDLWEEESIEKIREKARELREQLAQPLATQVSELSKRLEPYSEQLTQARDRDDFVETDLNYWKEKLALIKSDLITPLKFSITPDDNHPLVSNRSIVLKTMNERFDRVLDDKVRIIEDGEVVVHDGPNSQNEIRGRNEYSTGCHKIRLRMEYTTNASLFLGVNSKTTPLQSASHTVKSVYMWYGNNYIYSEGSGKSTGLNPPLTMNKHDVITLIFDCDNRKIAIINECTSVKHEVTVNLGSCPFPWQLYVNMCNIQESVRLLPS